MGQVMGLRILAAGIVTDHLIHITDNERRVIAMAPSIPESMERNDAWYLEDFVLIKELYRGKSSLVYSAIDRQSGLEVALKVYRKHKLCTLSRYQVEREIRIHIALDHDHIIKLYTAFEDEKNVYLVQELAGHGSLSQVMKSNGGTVKEKYAVRDVLAPFLNALHYLHGLNIIHRDIKPENLLVTTVNQSNRSSKTMMIKVVDFGLSIDYSSERPITRCGSHAYMSPEVLACPEKSRPEENKDLTQLVYGPSVDVWSIGILAYELIVGLPPFEKVSRTETYNDILHSKPQLPASMSSQCKSFILSALEKNATQRPSIADLLNHPWIQKYALSHHLVGQRPTQAEITSPTHTRPRQRTISDHCVLPPAILQSFLSEGGKVDSSRLEPQSNLSSAPPSKSIDGTSSSSVKLQPLPLLPVGSYNLRPKSSSHLAPIMNSKTSIDKSPASPTLLSPPSTDVLSGHLQPSVALTLSPTRSSPRLKKSSSHLTPISMNNKTSMDKSPASPTLLSPSPSTGVLSDDSMFELRSRQLRTGPYNQSFVYPNYNPSMVRKYSCPLGVTDQTAKGGSTSLDAAILSSNSSRQDSGSLSFK